MVTAIEGFFGRYTGRGEWREANGIADRYSITHTIEPAECGFRLAFRHVFDNGDPSVDAVFDMTWATDTLFTVSVGGAPAGKGYVYEGFCHTTLEIGGQVVETSCVRTEPGMRVFGSSSRNKAGNAIAWREELMREAE